MKYNIQLELSNNIVDELRDGSIELSFLQPFKTLSLPLKGEGRYKISVKQIDDSYLIKKEVITTSK